MPYKPLKQYQLIAKALHKVKPSNVNEWGYSDQPRVEQWNACVESIANELSDSAYRPEFLAIADNGKVWE